MSYDVSMEADLGGPEPMCIRDWNFTSNVAPMWRHAGADLRELDRMPATEAVPILRKAIEAMEADPATYRAMNPSNGWGDYDGCLRFLRGIRDACEAYPRGTTLRVGW